MAVAAVRQLLGDLSPVRFQVPEPEGRIQFPLFDVSVRPLLTASSHGDATAPTIPCDDAVRHFPSRRCRVKFVVKGLLLNVVEGIEKFMLDTETSG